ncbi:trypsin-like peptidase domain-containing protein [Candidatus Saccharibacteria bacterium]|nr:trypsin-like peptidase domain-containing protein [Candidatus Saccharibacteria bacterium]
MSETSSSSQNHLADQSAQTQGNPTSHDWRNYRSPASTTHAAHPVKTSKPRTASSPATPLAIFALLLGAIGCTLGVIAALNSFNASNANTPSQTANNASYYSGNSAEFKETSIASIANKVTPAVVSIVAESYSPTNFFNYFSDSTTQSAGTGMIVSTDGYILTNKHVVSGASGFKVITDSGDTYEDVEVVGTDPLNDLAFLKINGVSDLPTVTLGDSKTIAAGQPVLAIGNALGAYQNSVTQGIVSGTGRSLAASNSDGSGTETLTDMIQTDAAINPGNSGGPLVNAAGDVIGINTAVSASAQGLGFAIPIAAAKGMLHSLIEDGTAARAYLGVAYITLTADIAKTYDLPVNQGAYLHSANSRAAIASGGPADKAGLRADDIITKVGDVEIGHAGSILTLVGEYKAGDTVQITYLRGDKTHTTNLTLGAYDE